MNEMNALCLAFLCMCFVFIFRRNNTQDDFVISDRVDFHRYDEILYSVGNIKAKLIILIESAMVDVLVPNSSFICSL